MLELSSPGCDHLCAETIVLYYCLLIVLSYRLILNVTNKLLHLMNNSEPGFLILLQIF